MREQVSAQAQRVLGVLSGERCHLSAEEILGRLDGVGTATVYRALERLTEKGLVRRLDVGQKRVLYEYAREKHMHFVCERCGRVFDIPADLSGVVLEAAKVCGHQAEWSEVTARGVCKDCLAREAGDFQ